MFLLFKSKLLNNSLSLFLKRRSLDLISGSQGRPDRASSLFSPVTPYSLVVLDLLPLDGSTNVRPALCVVDRSFGDRVLF